MQQSAEVFAEFRAASVFDAPAVDARDSPEVVFRITLKTDGPAAERHVA